MVALRLIFSSPSGILSIVSGSSAMSLPIFRRDGEAVVGAPGGLAFRLAGDKRCGVSTCSALLPF